MIRTIDVHAIPTDTDKGKDQPQQPNNPNSNPQPSPSPTPNPRRRSRVRKRPPSLAFEIAWRTTVFLSGLLLFFGLWSLANPLQITKSFTYEQLQ